jgi:hypothetical protein
MRLFKVLTSPPYIPSSRGGPLEKAENTSSANGLATSSSKANAVAKAILEGILQGSKRTPVRRSQQQLFAKFGGFKGHRTSSQSQPILIS